MGNATKRWSYSTGERGRNRVRAYEEAKTGILYLEFYERLPGREDPKRKRVSLGHRDRTRAKQQADEVAAKVGRASKVLGGDVTLRELFDIYKSEVTPEKAERTRKHDGTCAEMFLRFFGGGRKARSLNRRDWDSFIRERGDGRIRPAGKKRATSVGKRTIERDLRWLHAVLNWATLARDDDGNLLLEQNPLKGLPFPKEKNPRRPRLTHERYERMREVAVEVDWRFELALVIAHETGHRIGAVRCLRWSDIDLKEGVIHWRADADKMGFEHATPISTAAREALRSARAKVPAIGNACLFPSPEDPTRPCSRNLVRDWWHRAEREAELEHIDGLGWHSLRRKFATEMKHAPIKDLCRLGGWKSERTIFECYQQADEQTMRDALDKREMLREASGG